MSMFQQHTTCDAYTQTLIPIVVLHFFSSSSSWWFFPIYFHHSSISFLFISMGIAGITTLVGFSSLRKSSYARRMDPKERIQGKREERFEERNHRLTGEEETGRKYLRAQPLSVFGSTHSYSAAVSHERVAAATASFEDHCWVSSVKREEMSGEKQWSHGNDRKRKWEGKISKRNRLATSKFYHHSRSLFGPDEEQKVSKRKMNNSREWTTLVNEHKHVSVHFHFHPSCFLHIVTLSFSSPSPRVGQPFEPSIWQAFQQFVLFSKKRCDKFLKHPSLFEHLMNWIYEKKSEASLFISLSRLFPPFCLHLSRSRFLLVQFLEKWWKTWLCHPCSWTRL